MKIHFTAPDEARLSLFTTCNFELLTATNRGDVRNHSATAERRPKANKSTSGDHNQSNWTELIKVAQEITETAVLNKGCKMPFREQPNGQSHDAADNTKGRRFVMKKAGAESQQAARQHQGVKALVRYPNETEETNHTPCDCSGQDKNCLFYCGLLHAWRRISLAVQPARSGVVRRPVTEAGNAWSRSRGPVPDLPRLRPYGTHYFPIVTDTLNSELCCPVLALDIHRQYNFRI